MNSAKELRARKIEIEFQARSELDKAQVAGADAAHIEATVDRMLAEADSLEARAKRYDDLEARDAAMNAADIRRPSEERKIETASVEVRASEAFGKLIRAGGMEGMSTEERTLLVRDAQTTGVAVDGGYAVPTTLYGEIIKAATVFGPMLNSTYFNVINTNSGNPMNFAVSNSTRKARLIGEGVTANEVAEKLSQKTLDAYKLTTDAAVASRELLQDAGVNIEEWLVGQLAESVGLGANDYLTNGTGSAQPNGIVTALTATAEVSASATGVTADEILDLQYGVNFAYRGRGRYMISSKLEKQLRKAKDTTGQYIWQPSMIAGVPNAIHGVEYFVNDDMADIGVSPAGKVAAVFGDFKCYTVRLSRALGLTRLVEKYALSDQIGWVGFARIDGELLQPAGLKALKIKAS